VQDQIQTASQTPNQHSIVAKAQVPAGFAASNYARLVNMFGYGLWSDDPGPLDLETAIKQSAVLASLDVISQDIAKTPLRLRQRLPNGGSEVIDPSGHWLAGMLATEPNRHLTWYEFVQMIVLHYGAVQNAFIAKKMTRLGQVTELVPMLPARVSILVDEESGRYVYDVDRLTPHEKIMLRGIDRYLLEEEVIHIRGRMFDGLFGYSNLEAGSAIMSLNKAVQDYQTRLYKNDAVLRGVFQMKNEETLSDEAYQRLKEQLRNLWKDTRDKGVPLVLEEGMEFNPISMQADAAETSKAKQNAVEDVARLFRIPPHKLMHIVNVKYENMETLEKSYVRDTLFPIATAIEQRVSRGVLSTAERLSGIYLEFDREAMELTDVEKQSEMIQVMLQNAAMTIDEARMRRGMNPLPNGAGAVRLIPANYSIIDDSNEIVLPAGGAVEEPEAEDDEDTTESEKYLIPMVDSPVAVTQGVAPSIDDVISAIRAMPAPIVNVDVKAPEIRAGDVKVDVHAHIPRRGAVEKTVTAYDENGRIVGMTEKEIDE
jgi:HK97 family phage portal protein